MNQKNRRRYVLLPSTGVVGDAVQASLKSYKNILATYSDKSGSVAEHAAETASLASIHGEMLGVSEHDMEIVSNRFEDGPATVKMSEKGVMILQATYPDMRIVPITNYYLPGRRIIKKTNRDNSLASIEVAAIDATDSEGNVFSEDAKSWALEVTDIEGDGTGIAVGVIDSGVDGNHPALANKVVVSRSFVEGEDNLDGGPVNWPNQPDLAAHGTHVAGIIAAQPGFGGPAGVAPGAEIVSHRVFGAAKQGAENASIIDAIRAAIDEGCDIINLSIAGSSLKADGIRSALRDAWENGVVCIAAAGNRYGNPVSYPAAHQHCLAVTAFGRLGAFPLFPKLEAQVSDVQSSVDPNVFLAKFSNFGRQVQFTAPGHAIVSTFTDSRWMIDSGTSMASPYIAGILARLLSANLNVKNMSGNATRSSAMVQMLISRSQQFGFRQKSMEGFGLPQ